MLLNQTASMEEVNQIAQKNERMRDVAEVVRQMGMIGALRALYDGYWRAKRDRWDEDAYVRDEGIAMGKTEDILQLLQNINMNEKLPSDLIQKITAQKEKDTLKRWLLSAAKAESVEQFREQEDL